MVASGKEEVVADLAVAARVVAGSAAVVVWAMEVTDLAVEDLEVEVSATEVVDSVAEA